MVRSFVRSTPSPACNRPGRRAARGERNASVTLDSCVDSLNVVVVGEGENIDGREEEEEEAHHR